MTLVSIPSFAEDIRSSSISQQKRFDEKIVERLDEAFRNFHSSVGHEKQWRDTAGNIASEQFNKLCESLETFVEDWRKSVDNDHIRHRLDDGLKQNVALQKLGLCAVQLEEDIFDPLLASLHITDSYEPRRTDWRRNFDAQVPGRRNVKEERKLMRNLYKITDDIIKKVIKNRLETRVELVVELLKIIKIHRMYTTVKKGVYSKPLTTDRTLYPTTS